MKENDRDEVCEQPQKRDERPGSEPISGEEERKESCADSALPGEYEVDTLQAVQCSPGQVFVWWELGGETGRRLRERAPSVEWALRVVDVGQGTEAEIKVDPRARNHYLNVRPEHHYRIELGVLTRGGYHPVADGAEVRMAPREASGEEGVEWVDLGEASREPEEGPGQAPAQNPKAVGLEWKPWLLDAGSSASLASSSFSPGQDVDQADQA